MPPSARAIESDESSPLIDRYRRIRRETLDLVAPLEVEDMVVQSMPEASPVRWHLAHATWFFEHFILAPRQERLPNDRPGWDYLFNSYYYSVGDMHRRPERGLLSRPTVAEILEYRDETDERLTGLLEAKPVEPDLAFLVELGLNHEQQHQELILTDIKHALSCNPLKPAYRPGGQPGPAAAGDLDYARFDGGVAPIGARAGGFCFDNETPRHDALLQPFSLANRPVNNEEFRTFVREGGYRHPDLWLSDGWAWVLANGINRPLYWSESLDSEFSLLGEISLDGGRPACHLNYYEADAFARWAGARLPTEFEWEHAAGPSGVKGNLLEQRLFHPGGPAQGDSIRRLFGDVWEWTASPYSAYPGFRPLQGSLGEYNGKFMCSQMVLRGGSCATPMEHIRTSYRNFFYPDARWQLSGTRLARDA
jgi:ergothioneine biosynthesis protein EgtB